VIDTHTYTHPQKHALLNATSKAALYGIGACTDVICMAEEVAEDDNFAENNTIHYKNFKKESQMSH
jgi:hypothetical protein